MVNVSVTKTFCFAVGKNNHSRSTCLFWTSRIIVHQQSFFFFLNEYWSGVQHNSNLEHPPPPGCKWYNKMNHCNLILVDHYFNISSHSFIMTNQVISISKSSSLIFDLLNKALTNNNEYPKTFFHTEINIFIDYV